MLQGCIRALGARIGKIVHFKSVDSYSRYKGPSGRLHNRFNETIQIHHVLTTPFEELVGQGQVDSLVVEPEDGFSILGSLRDYLSRTLGLRERNQIGWVLAGMRKDFQPDISSLADWMRNTDPDVTILGLRNRSTESPFKGLVMVPYEDSLCYRRFARTRYNKPYRDFFYNVTYESLFYAYHIMGARNFAVSHLSALKYGNGGYRADITMAQSEAILHFCNSYRGIRHITFLDSAEGNLPIAAIASLTTNRRCGKHRAITTCHDTRMGFDFITLDWQLPDNHQPS